MAEAILRRALKALALAREAISHFGVGEYKEVVTDELGEAYNEILIHLIKSSKPSYKELNEILAQNERCFYCQAHTSRGCECNG